MCQLKVQVRKTAFLIRRTFLIINFSLELGSPTSPVDDELYEPPPGKKQMNNNVVNFFSTFRNYSIDLPAKVRLRTGGGMSGGYDMQQFVGRHHQQSQSQRSRGGEQLDLDENDIEDDDEDDDENAYMENQEDLEEEEEDDLNIDDSLVAVPQSSGNSGLAGTLL